MAAGSSTFLLRAPEGPPIAPGTDQRHDQGDTEFGATCALTALTVVSALAFARVFTTSGWLVPVMASAVAGHYVAWRLRRRQVSPLLALSVSLGVTAIAGCYLVLPGDLTWGLPLGHMWHAVDAAMRQAGDGIRTQITPVPAASGFSLLIAWGAGVAAAGADFLAFRRGSPLQALAPSFTLFLTACAIGTSRGRGWTVGTEVAAMVIFLLVERIDRQRRYAIWLGGRRGRTTQTLLSAGAVMAAVAVVAAITVTPAVPNREGDGLLGWRSPAGAGGGTRITPSPFDDLRTRLLDNSDTVVMTVVSSEPSYWRLTSLDTFNGTVWSSNDSYQRTGRRLPGVSYSPGTRQVTEQFQIAALDSIWLPTGFNPERIDDVDDVSWDAASGSLISSKPTSDGETYTVEASQELATLSPALLSSAPPLSAGDLPQDLALPSNIPSHVAQLARRITAGANTEYAKALALEQYFHESMFTYSLNPISDDSVSALTTFLFHTHQGYCQQYAGAYAVLARDVGLPTRIAVGFQTGQGSNGLYAVTDADAHAWPEVWFPNIGWVPFEPTPGRQVPAASYTGQTSRVNGVAPSAPTTVAPTPTTTAPKSRLVPRLAPAAGSGAAAAAASHKHSGSNPLVEIGGALGIVAGLAGVWIAILAAVRRLRWRRRRSRAWAPSPDGQPPYPFPGYVVDDARPDRQAGGRVLVAWAEVAELLSMWRLRRRAHETVMEFAARAIVELHAALVDPTLDQLGKLAGLVQLAEFSSPGLSPEAAREAERLAGNLVEQLRRAASPGRRIEHLIDPRQAWRPTTIDAIDDIPVV